MDNIDIKVVYTKCEFDCQQGDYGGDCSCSHSMDTKILSLPELIREDWFIEYIRNNGFFYKDDEGLAIEYLDRYVYEYSLNSFDEKYSQFTCNIKDIGEYRNIKRVYQEVVGPERIKAFAKWKKEAAIIQNKLDRQEASREKRRLKAVAKAKSLLEKEGILT